VGLGANKYLQNKCLVFKIGFCNFAPLNLILSIVIRLKEYTIQFVGLELGNHQFEFEVNDSFFEHFEFSQIQHGQIHVTVDLEKMERMMILNIGIEGEALVSCDRCTNEFSFPISDTQRLIVKLGAEYMEESEDVVVIPETEYKFDLSTYIYEFIHLALPARLLHPDDEDGNSTCDPDILRLLETLTSTETLDPRWEALKKLNTDQ
jgi:uncharacterized metal-binding protein YceD (DUF177 family)